MSFTAHLKLNAVMAVFMVSSCCCSPMFGGSVIDHSLARRGANHVHAGRSYSPAPSMLGSMNTINNPQPRGSSFSFAVVADTQGQEFGGSLLTSTVASINTHNVEYVLFPGDLVADTGLNGWNSWRNTTNAFGINSLGRDKRLMTPGNHDVGSGVGAWQSAFSFLPDSNTVNGITGINQIDYFVDHENVRFISISTDVPGGQHGGLPNALNWLREVMKDVDIRNSDEDPENNIDHVFTFSHRPVTTQFESGTGGTNGAWWESMTGQDANSGNHAATALLAGHWHMYQPSRPDVDVDTMELISGTGGGGLEGAPHRNRHGYSIVTVNGGNVSSEFFAATNIGGGNWIFSSADQVTIAVEGGLPKGELAKYEFTEIISTLDTSVSPLSKHHVLNFQGASVEFDLDQLSDVLNTSTGYVDAKRIGDNNLAVLGDMSISFDAKLIALPVGPSQVIAVFGGANGSFNGSLNSQESANVIYELSMTPGGRLRMNWQHDDAQWEGAILSETLSSIGLDPLDWHRYRVVRHQLTKEVVFTADGIEFGRVSFENFPTGGGSGSLYIGGNIGGGNLFNGLLDNLVIANNPYQPGDVNRDGFINLLDVAPFVALLSAGTYQVEADVNQDGVLNLLDVGPFVGLLGG